MRKIAAWEGRPIEELTKDELIEALERLSNQIPSGGVAPAPHDAEKPQAIGPATNKRLTVKTRLEELRKEPSQ